MLIIIIHVHCRVLHFYTISINMIYLDNNATTPLELDVKEAITSALSKAWGNPSSSHTQGKSHRPRLFARRSLPLTNVIRTTVVLITNILSARQ